MTTSFGKERHYTSAGDIYAVLKALQADRASVTIQFDGSKAVAASMVLDIDLKARRFRLDQFSTSDADKKAEAGSKFTMRASVNGIRVVAKDLEIHKIGKDDGGLYYDVNFPTSLLYMQRRDAFRAWVPGALAVKTVLTSSSYPKPVEGRIQNMSATGCRVIVDGQLTPMPEMMQRFHLSTYLPLTDQDLSCEVSTAYSHYQPERNQTAIGLRFENLRRPDQVTINRFVIQLQREAIA